MSYEVHTHLIQNLCLAHSQVTKNIKNVLAYLVRNLCPAHSQVITDERWVCWTPKVSQQRV